jgi:hypothetical protein
MKKLGVAFLIALGAALLSIAAMVAFVPDEDWAGIAVSTELGAGHQPAGHPPRRGPGHHVMTTWWDGGSSFLTGGILDIVFVEKWAPSATRKISTQRPARYRHQDRAWDAD